MVMLWSTVKQGLFILVYFSTKFLRYSNPCNSCRHTENANINAEANCQFASAKILPRQKNQLFFKLPNYTKLTHMNAFTFTSVTPVLHIYMKQVRAADNDLSSFSFLLKMTDMAGIIRIAQKLTCVISYDKAQTLCYQFYLLLTFVIQLCYAFIRNA